jgi:hypothetical protein
MRPVYAIAITAMLAITTPAAADSWKDKGNHDHKRYARHGYYLPNPHHTYSPHARYYDRGEWRRFSPGQWTRYDRGEWKHPGHGGWRYTDHGGWKRTDHGGWKQSWREGPCTVARKVQRDGDYKQVVKCDRPNHASPAGRAAYPGAIPPWFTMFFPDD